MPQEDFYQLEELEPRILLSADWTGVFGGETLEEESPWEPEEVEVEFLDVYSGVSESIQPLSESSEQSESAVSDEPSEVRRREIVFVDSDVPDYGTLVDDLVSYDSGRYLDVVVLRSDSDGVEQITQALAEYDDLDAVHIISHGNKEAVRLGDSWLTRGSLEWYSGAISGWSDALTGGADILFYGCDLAGGSEGRALVEAISKLTGADVAASSDV